MDPTEGKQASPNSLASRLKVTEVIEFVDALPFQPSILIDSGGGTIIDADRERQGKPAPGRLRDRRR